ncbi:MAG: hypothetical protein HUJ71_02070 [Pseudobutyrivibrio sp.]|nr:hypothetical protein [Pseudobutyrivibrio sp.]
MPLAPHNAVLGSNPNVPIVITFGSSLKIATRVAANCMPNKAVVAKNTSPTSKVKKEGLSCRYQEILLAYINRRTVFNTDR